MKGWRRGGAEGRSGLSHYSTTPLLHYSTPLRASPLRASPLRPSAPPRLTPQPGSLR